MFAPHHNCRACDHPDLTEVFSFGKPMPLANDFARHGERRNGFYPVTIALCEKCGLSQLTAVVDPQVLYNRYLYTTSSSITMQRHLDRLFQDIASEKVGSRLLECGSNDGRTLWYAKNGSGFDVLGIDPAENLCKIASEEHGINTLCRFFDVEAAERAVSILGTPSVILARHCFAHQDSWHGFVKALEAISDHKTLVCIEVPHVKDTLARCEFDQAYSEHLSFVSLSAIAALLKGTQFHVHRVQHYAIHGGALLIMLRHNNSTVTPHLSADEYLSEEQVTVKQWQHFGVMARQKISRMREAVLEAKEQGNIVCGFGASAKASVWISACDFTDKDIRFVFDNSPLKPGRLMPGTEIPIVHQDEMLSEHPDVAICFAWNYRNEILETQKKWRARGGKFIFPTPDGIEIV